MSCCGNKRNEWLNASKYSEFPLLDETEAIVAEEKSEVIFEYTGDYSFRITGVSTGKSYHFKFKGDKQYVDNSDSFALMGEMNLSVSAKEAV